jgi:hypothetical protein
MAKPRATVSGSMSWPGTPPFMKSPISPVIGALLRRCLIGIGDSNRGDSEFDGKLISLRAKLDRPPTRMDVSVRAPPDLVTLTAASLAQPLVTFWWDAESAMRAGGHRPRLRYGRTQKKNALIADGGQAPCVVICVRGRDAIFGRGAHREISTFRGRAGRQEGTSM